jgi:tetratricopeptide (TPR) repeat protein
MMSGAEKAGDNNMNCCASCGIAEGDETKLKTCTACKSVRYCGVKCQRDHRPQHKRYCKKRADELRDEILFQQPESSFLGDCQICCLPLLADQENSIFTPCCSKVICNGCNYANQAREREGSLERRCPFCRHSIPKSLDETIQIIMKRVAANDPVAMRQMGTYRYSAGDYNGAFEYYTKAAGLGDLGAHYELSVLYDEGKGIAKDKKKRLHHLEEAAIGGHPSARYNLACVEWNNGRKDRAIKHWIIAANLGNDVSLKPLKMSFQMGLMSKEDFAASLRAHQAAIDATKSPQREIAAPLPSLTR